MLDLRCKNLNGVYFVIWKHWDLMTKCIYPQNALKLTKNCVIETATFFFVSVEDLNLIKLKSEFTNLSSKFDSTQMKTFQTWNVKLPVKLAAGIGYVTNLKKKIFTTVFKSKMLLPKLQQLQRTKATLYPSIE